MVNANEVLQTFPFASIQQTLWTVNSKVIEQDVRSALVKCTGDQGNSTPRERIVCSSGNLGPIDK
jgi:hypothetical protein